MNTFIRVIRYAYEEPYHLNLVMLASNGYVLGRCELYVTPEDLVSWADEMESFPKHIDSVLLWEIGSERPEDRFAYYFRMRVFTTDRSGHSAVQLRFNNNEPLPEREVMEFCIKADAAQINRLGQLCREFARLKHEVLEWSPACGQLFESKEDEQLAASWAAGVLRS
jgi:hypothetical protein